MAEESLTPSPVPQTLPVFTTRLVLRRLSTADLGDFQSYRTDPEVGKYQGWNSTPDSEALEFLNEMAAAEELKLGDWFQLGIALREDNTLIGDIGVHISEDGTEAHVGFSVARRFQGQGFAFEAIECLITTILPRRGVGRVIGITDSRNAPSIKLLTRLGMAFTNSFEFDEEGEGDTALAFGMDIHAKGEA